ncbi:MAG: hypothetical protein H6588_08715 [Flavobacteriales bacterium]|nr:hypothetical protein [Flavobacteriales bacterium]
MNKTYLFITLLIMLFLGNCLQAQDKLLFLNGKEIEGSILSQNKYELTFKDTKNKEFAIDTYRLFSYSKNSTETIVYKYDTLEGNFLKVQDMKMFVYGERGAYQSFSSPITNVAGLLIGGAAGYFMQKDQAFLYVATPLVYTTITLPFPTSVKQRRLTNLEHIKDDEYLRGYERVARSKRTQNALKSSIVGTAAGFLVGLIVNK